MSTSGTAPTARKRQPPGNPDYAYNATLYAVDPATNHAARLALGDIANPEQVECTGDARQAFSLRNNMAADEEQQQQDGKWVMPAITHQGDVRHNGGIIMSFLDGHVKWLHPDEYGRGFNRYNIPTQQAYYIDFSKVSVPQAILQETGAARQADLNNFILRHSFTLQDGKTRVSDGVGMSDGFQQEQAGTFPAGMFDYRHKGWAVPANGLLCSRLNTGFNGYSMMVEFTTDSAVQDSEITLGRNDGWGNCVTLFPAQGKAGFGAFDPGQPEAPRYLSPTCQGKLLTGLAPGGASYRLQCSLGYAIADRSLKDQSYAKNSDSSLFLLQANDQHSSCIPTPMKASVEELAPIYGILSWGGFYLAASSDTDNNDRALHTRQPILVKKILFSN